MIRANELRIGNYVRFWGTESIIYAINNNDPNNAFVFAGIYKDISIEDLEPIPLTECILLGIKNAFVAAKDKTKICITAAYGFEFHFDKYGEDYVLSIYCRTGCVVPQKCSNLHEFQNIYFALTGEELTFK